MNAGQISIVSSDPQAMAAVLAAVKMVGVIEPPLTPRGELGGCAACGHTVASHFGSDNRWLGCLKGDENTVYILMAVPRKNEVRKLAVKAAAATNGHGKAPKATAQERVNHTPVAPAVTEPAVVMRGAKRYRYTSALHHKANPAKLPLSPTRLKVLATIHKTGKSGLVAKQIMAKARLPHGSVQQTLNWLRANELVKAHTVALNGNG